MGAVGRRSRYGLSVGLGSAFRRCSRARASAAYAVTLAHNAAEGWAKALRYGGRYGGVPYNGLNGYVSDASLGSSADGVTRVQGPLAPRVAGATLDKGVPS